MRKYRSLLFREYKLSRNHYAFRFIILLLFLGLVFLTLLLNGDEPQETINSISMFMALLFAVIAGFVCVDDNGVHRSDINAGWHTYSYCLPISPGEKSVVRYFVKVLAILAGAGMTALGCQGIAAMTDAKADMRVLYVFLVVTNISLLVQILTDAVSLVLKGMGDAYKVWIVIVAMVLFITIWGPKLIPQNSLQIPEEELGVVLPKLIFQSIMKFIDKIDLFLIPLLIVLLAVSFAITYQTYERRKIL